eukprot:2032382-Pleurochrysis_carterae.AAC.1
MHSTVLQIGPASHVYIWSARVPLPKLLKPLLAMAAADLYVLSHPARTVALVDPDRESEGMEHVSSGVRG